MNAFSWISAHPFRFLIALAILTILAFTAFALTRQARQDRPWAEYLSRLPHVALNHGIFSVTPVSDWSYSASGPTDKAETDFQASVADVKSVWLMVEPSPYSTIVAHTLLLFEFTDGRVIGLTIEARLTKTQKYSPIDGLWNKYELIYLWATPRDLLIRRSVFLDHKVYLYPLKLTNPQLTSLFAKLVKTTGDLQFRPRFYNTLFHNCTNELGQKAGLPWDISFVLTGLSPNYLYRKGIIPGASFDDAKAKADLTDWLKANNDPNKAAFEPKLVAELRARGER